jgi:metallo-beta-lactamase family protein
MKLKFCGAAKIVTGSCYWIKSGKTQLLVDCGMFQGTKDITRLNYEEFLFDPRDIDYLLLTHAHIDHSGLIPKLCAEGFKGKILTTPTTFDLAKIMLADSAHVQEMDTERENRRRNREGSKPRDPLYTIEDVKNCMPDFKLAKYGKKYGINDDIEVRFNDAGHILGSSIIELFITEKGVEKKLVFSGDLGTWNTPIVRDPSLIDFATYVFVESTYGNRLHEKKDQTYKKLSKIINQTYKKGGRLMIPSFAVERTQELLLAIKTLIKNGDFPNQKVFLDSPLAIRATNVFKKHKEVMDKTALDLGDPFTFPGLEFTLKANQSMKLNDYKEPCIIIAGSGMCTGGRIKHHFKHGIWNPKNTVLFVGYQAKGTLGRVILEGAKKVKMMGHEIVVGAKIEKINSFSAHADYLSLLKWMGGFKKKPLKVFVTHGEEESSEEFKLKLEKKGFKCHIPSLGEEVTL